MNDRDHDTQSNQATGKLFPSPFVSIEFSNCLSELQNANELTQLVQNMLD